MKSRGAGGAANWKGTEHERGAAAYLASHCLANETVRQLDLPVEKAIPEGIRLQADDPIDDIVCSLSGGGHAYFQARTTLNFRAHRSTGFRWVARQWVEQMEATNLDPKRDRVVALAHRVSPDVEILQSALDRLRQRGDGDLDNTQREQLNRLEAMLGGLSVRTRSRLLRCAQIWVLRVSDELEASRAQCRQLLGSQVVPEVHSDGAWERLLNVCGRGARLRYGFDRQQLCDELRGKDLPLREDEPGSVGARRGAMARYLERIQRRGKQLDFAGLAATIPPLTLERADADVRVSPGVPGEVEEERYGDPMTWALRRRGRILLTGLPGAGKSTALRTVASEYAKRPGWPLPIVVRLDKLGKRIVELGVREALVDLAVSSASGMDRAILASQLDDSLNGPNVAIFLDALDEARSDRHEVLRQLKDLFAELHPDTEIVLATRDVAYADAASLKFFEMRLLAPRDSVAPARAVLEELAERFAPADQCEDWIKVRIDWVEGWLERDKALAETPLLSVLLAMLAASRSENVLPKSRAAVMVEVLEAVIEQWEASGERSHVGNLQERLARRALIESFMILSKALIEQELPETEDCRKVVAKALQNGFELSTVAAEVCAEDAVAFWDQAGFFVLGSDGRLFPRLRLFVELGEAWRASNLTDTKSVAWVHATLADRERIETLRLASQLSTKIARSVIETAAERRAPELILRANDVTAGAAHQSAATRNLLSKALVEAISSGEHAERRAAAEALMSFELPKKLREETRRSLVSLPADQRPAFEALLALKTSHPSTEERAAIRRVIDTDPPEREKPEDAGAFVLTLAIADPIWSRAISDSFERLLPHDRSLAPRGLHLIEKIGGRHSERLEELLRRDGDEEIISALDRLYQERFGNLGRANRFLYDIEVRHEADREFLLWLSKMADPIELQPGQRRRLDALADLWVTLGLPSAPAYAPSNTLKAAPKLLHECMLVLVRLSGVELSVVASEAASLLKEGRHHPEDREALESMLNMRGISLEFSHWDQIDDRPSTRRLLHRALALGHWFSWLAIQALANSGMEKCDVEEIVELLPRLRHMNRFEAARLVLAAEGTERAAEWLEGEDAWLRNAAAWRVAAAIQTQQDATLLVKVLADEDNEVRTTMVESLDAPLSGDVRRVLCSADRDPRPWTCMSCGYENPGGNSGCKSCHFVGGDFASKLAKLLKADNRSGE